MVRDWDFGHFPAWIFPTVCMMAAGAIHAADQEVPPPLALLAAPAPPLPPPIPGEPRQGARRWGHGSPRAGRGSAAGANPPARRPARHLAGHPSKTVRHGFPVGSPLRQTNPGSLNLSGKSPAGRRAGGKEGAAAARRGGRGYYHALILSANPDFTL